MSNEVPVIECSTCGDVVSKTKYGHLMCANPFCRNTTIVNNGIKDLTDAGYEIAWRTVE